MDLLNSKLYFNYDELNMIKSYDDFLVVMSVVSLSTELNMFY